MSVPLSVVVPPNEVVGQVLAGVADDAEPVGGRVEVDPERGSRERDRELADEGRDRGVGVDHEHAAAVADAVEHAVLHPVVDPDQLGVVAVSALNLDFTEVAGRAGRVRAEPHQVTVVGQTDHSHAALAALPRVFVVVLGRGVSLDPASPSMRLSPSTPSTSLFR